MSVVVREKDKGSGVYWVFINHQGKRKSRKIGSKKLAHEVADQVNAHLQLGMLDLNEKGSRDNPPNFNCYSQVWLKMIKSTRKASTHERYESILRRFIVPEFGKGSISEISRADIRNFMLTLNEKGMSRASICLVRDVLSGIFGHALDDELLENNPVTGVLKRLKLDRKKKIVVQPFTHKETIHFIKTCQEHFPEYHAFFLTALRTGMRLGEILALQWDDIDFHGRFIRVHKGYRRGELGTTKTGKERRVDMSDQLVATLQALLAQRRREALREGRGEVCPIVFNRDGKHMEQNFIRRIFARVLLKAGMRRMRLHDLRHTYASQLLSNGQSPVYVQKQLGHSSISITVDVYGHLIPSNDRSAVNALDDDSAPLLHPSKQKGLKL